jgi:hypothetical protein
MTATSTIAPARHAPELLGQTVVVIGGNAEPEDADGSRSPPSPAPSASSRSNLNRCVGSVRSPFLEIRRTTMSVQHSLIGGRHLLASTLVGTSAYFFP